MKLKLEQESKVGRVSHSGSSLMPVKDMFAVDTMTSQQLRIVKYTATKLLIGLLADQSLITQVIKHNSLLVIYIRKHLSGGRGILIKLFLCYSIVYNYNGA